jgi:hypothetical protein
MYMPIVLVFSRTHAQYLTDEHPLMHCGLWLCVGTPKEEEVMKVVANLIMNKDSLLPSSS